jgi:hypothetical protein
MKGSQQNEATHAKLQSDGGHHEGASTMTYTPSELFTNKMVNACGHWIDPTGLNFVSCVLEDNSIVIDRSELGCLELPYEGFGEAIRARDILLQAWDRELQRAELEKQFKEGLEREEAHGVEIVVNMPLDTPKDTIQQAINEATAAILARVDDVGGGL